MLQEVRAVSESPMFGKLENETKPFGKELNTAMPQRHQTGMRPLWEGPLRRVLPQAGLIKLSGGTQPLETVKR